MEFVEPEDEPQAFRSPPPPDDRVWRHPSEMSLKTPSPRRQLWAVGFVSALAASMLSTGFAVVAGTLLDQDRPSTTLRSSVLPGLPPVVATDAVVEVAERLRPAIVQLKVEKGRTGSGSGVIFRSDGHILTNAHVVEGATSVTAVLSDGRQLAARVVGSDAGTDTAVVKIEAGPHQVAQLGTTAGLKVGQRAVAIGSPLGLAGGPSVTVGVVSALHRTVRTRGGQSLSDMIQTDAPIAPGSSGGALLDAGGNVIGVTTAVAITDSGNEGFGFAVPIDSARSAADQLISTGKVITVWMGVECSDLDGATAVDLKVAGGTMVDKVRSDSPAEQAGLAARDVIVSINGRPVTSLGMLIAVLRQHRPGDVVAVDVIRDRQHHAMAVTVAERPPGS